MVWNSSIEHLNTSVSSLQGGWMELVRISLAFSACCLACSDSPADKERGLSFSFTSVGRDQSYLWLGNRTRSPSSIGKRHTEMDQDSVKYCPDSKNRRSGFHRVHKTTFSPYGLSRSKQSEQELNNFETSPISEIQQVLNNYKKTNGMQGLQHSGQEIRYS